MDKPCAIQADFADFRRVKGRKVLQLFFEIPLEQSEEALRVLGHPTVGESKWCAIALLDLSKPSAAPQAQADPTKDRRPFSSLPLSQQIGIRCNEKDFQRFCEYETVEETAQHVRLCCGVESRAFIVDGTQAAAMWLAIEQNYQSWLVTERYAESKR